MQDSKRESVCVLAKIPSFLDKFPCLLEREGQDDRLAFSKRVERAHVHVPSVSNLLLGVLFKRHFYTSIDILTLCLLASSFP